MKNLQRIHCQTGILRTKQLSGSLVGPREPISRYNRRTRNHEADLCACSAFAAPVGRW
jgi:hypothetical protein